MSLPIHDNTVFDLVGLGFGPANIAIAGALTEQWADEKNVAPYPVKNVLFLEKHTHFCWHPGMLLPDTKMQIRSLHEGLGHPKSPYTFLSYLHSQDRLLSFINRGSTVPTRKEYSDYLSWAAAKVQANGVNVLYGHEIVGFKAAPENTIAIHYRNLSNGEETVVRSKNIIISPGGAPRIPEFLKPVIKHPHVVHSSGYATSISKTFEALLGVQRPLRVAVIGSGQSAAEVTIDLRNRLSNIPMTGQHQIDMLIRKGALKPSGDSPFANEIFDPASTDVFFSTSSRQSREMKLAEYKLTNYSVVNPCTLEALYEIIYGQRLDTGITNRLGDQGPIAEAFINIKPYTYTNDIILEDASNTDKQTDLLLSPESSSAADRNPPPTFLIKTQNIINLVAEEERYDAIVYATGYERSAWVNIIKDSDIAQHFGIDSSTSEVRLILSTEATLPIPQPKLFTASPSDSGASTPTISSSASSSPPTSPELDPFSSKVSRRSKGKDVFISRNYRLLPSGYGESTAEQEKSFFSPRVYLQGCEESTHGLTDTLLSVLGVRAGEVVRDLTYTV